MNDTVGVLTILSDDDVCKVSEVESLQRSLILVREETREGFVCRQTFTSCLNNDFGDFSFGLRCKFGILKQGIKELADAYRIIDAAKM